MDQIEQALAAELEQIRQRLQTIEERNQRVESDKAWETSACRKLTVALITYFLTACVFYAIGVQAFFLNALIPTAGYLLSTATLPKIKESWLSRRASLGAGSAGMARRNSVM